MLSRRRFLAASVAGAAGTFLAACAASVRSVEPHSSASASPPEPRPSNRPVTPAPSPVGLTLRDKIAAMLLVGFRGRTAAEAEIILRQIATLGVGGVVLFDIDQPTGEPRNVESPEQLARLVRSLRDAATRVPVTVAIDQEGGRVARLGESYGFPPTRSAADLGRIDDPAVTRAAAGATADVLVAAGITLNLAPVLDLAVNPANPVIAAVQRSYDAAPRLVEAHAAAFIEAHHERGIACALKHFPGHGSSAADTHLGVVDVTDSWTDRELEPFAALIERGLADSVLTAHVFNANLDPEHPATLSASTITGILRERIGFTGVVMSDDLQMGAIRDAYGYDEAVALAIEAGVDLLVIANQIAYEPDVASRTIDIVEGLVRSGRISDARIDESWRRISVLKGS